MNDTEYVALVDTTRHELRDRIEAARNRFDRLARTADPLARPPGSRWNVQQTVAHVLTVAHRYRELAHGREPRRGATAGELRAVNQAELEVALAPMHELADQIQALAPEIDGYFDMLADSRATVQFHTGVVVDDITAQTNWLGELLLHGYDIARGVKAPWELCERDMLLVSRGMVQIGAGYPLREGVSPDVDLSVAFELAGARPYLAHIHCGTAEFRPRRPNDRPDAVLRTPASTFALMLYQRIGPFTAVRRGLRIVGGRKPWRALKLQSCFERP
ncbi:hypothetical protein [Mycobacterium sp. E796]|uniref:hypothetical protein n=1 Tax=Mycobacterium sp. E796 TaxID=1834151 RepID=UPI0007FDB082|nr:hypothetical protein [Mycobacterium sp. E796]OBI44431.1 hypothetical protein A5706_03665 [Mycobacterium sp. E796]